MGCTESIISEIVAKNSKSNANGQKVIKNQSKVQPAPLRSDRGDREDARERRRKAVLERHAKRQAMAQTISENAMAEKERLSNSTWMSWRSGVNSDIISPAVSISVRGSDGTASPDQLPNPASAYIYSEEDPNPTSSTQQDINANDMQIRTMELPNQVAEGPDGLANQNRELNAERLSESVAKETIEEEKKDSMGKSSRSNGEQRVVEEPLLNKTELAGDGRPESKDELTPLMDNSKDEMEKVKKNRKKKGGKQKAVKFSDQDLEHESLKESQKETSKGR